MVHSRLNSTSPFHVGWFTSFFLPERPRERKGGKSPSSPDFLATLINYRLTQDKPGKGERGDYGGQKSSPFTLLLHCRGRGGRRGGGPDIISIIPPFPFPAALEVEISPPPPPNPFFPSTAWAGEFPPFPPSHFVTIFSLPSLEWKLMTLSRSPSQSQTEKLSNSKSSNPFFLLFNSFLFDRGFFFLCRRQRMA